MAGVKEREPLQELVDSFHTFLDEALIVAIAGDFDLKNPSAWRRARSTLEDLAQSVPAEEASGFNPSGIPLADEEETDGRSAHPDHGDASTWTRSASPGTSRACATDRSSTDTSSSCAADPPRHHLTRLTSFNSDSEEDKILILQGMFSELKPYDVSYALKKADGDFQMALDDLLNVQYLQSTGQQMRGVDGFFVADCAKKKKQGKKKKKKRQKEEEDDDDDNEEDEEGGICSDPDSSSRGSFHGQEQVRYIAERLGLPSDEVAPIYARCKGSQGATVAELLKQYMSHGIQAQDDEGKETASALAKKYRHVPPDFMPTIVHVSGSIPQFAQDVAALLNRHFSKPAKGKKMDLAYRLTPLPREEIEDESAIARGTDPPQPGSTGRPAPPGIKTLAEAIGRADAHDRARRDAAASAARLHRRGASSPLYRQAAGYYADTAREQAQQARHATSTAADLLVAQHSTTNSIDLHGVLVHDGVRIARQKVQAWWQGLGEMKARRAQEQGGFTVITGLGRHSAGGVSHLRQSVAAALLQDGWKLSIETGKFVVVGRRVGTGRG